MLKYIFLVLAAAVCMVSANTIKAVTCGTTKISEAAVRRNFNEGVRLLQLGSTVTSSSGTEYPHRYTRQDGLSLPGCDGQLYEFPLIKGDSAFSHLDNAGSNRVLFSQTGVYCAAVTHTGASTSGGFVLCK